MIRAAAGRMARVAVIVGVLAIAGSTPAVAQPFPEVQLYQLLPSDCPFSPGAPCACRRAGGEWISGVTTH